MILHVVMWNIREDIDRALADQGISRFKAEAEKLATTIPGVVMIEVHTEGFTTGNRDFMLVSAHNTVEDLAVYQNHEAHKKVGALIQDIATNRACFDYEKSFD